MKYAKYFRVHDRMAGEKPIAVVHYELFEQFIEEVVNDTELKSPYKAFILLAACGGLRISECLALTSKDIQFVDGFMYINVKVLKKRNPKPVYRIDDNDRHIQIKDGDTINYKDSFYKFSEDGKEYVKLTRIEVARAKADRYKKARESKRLMKVHPSATEFIKSYFDNVVGKPFKFNKLTTIRYLRKMTGFAEVTNHSLRHSTISYYLFKKGMNFETIKELMKVGSDSIKYYSHSDPVAELNKIF